MNEPIQVFDSAGDFLFSATDECELEALWKSAVEKGFRPVVKEGRDD